MLRNQSDDLRLIEKRVESISKEKDEVWSIKVEASEERIEC